MSAPNTIEAIIARSMPEPNSGCWLWLGAVDRGGYARTKYRGKALYAHCATWEAQHGPVPKGLELDHKCHVPSCINPSHLEPVTHDENMKRATAGTFHRAKTHCPRGHAYEGENLYVAPDRHGRRSCRICKREQLRASRARRHV